jgi:Uma2 family endonuclease
MYDLPSELVGESGLPDEFHLIQAALLTETCKPVGYEPEEILLASDLNLYYDPRHTQWYKRPDWYLVVDLPKVTPEPEMRLSYLVWQDRITRKPPMDRKFRIRLRFMAGCLSQFFEFMVTLV